MASAASGINPCSSIIIFVVAGVPRSGAAVGGTVPSHGDITAVAGVTLVKTQVTTFVLVRLTLLGAGVPLVSACDPTFHPTIFIRTVAADLSLGISCV